MSFVSSLSARLISRRIFHSQVCASCFLPSSVFMRSFEAIFTISQARKNGLLRCARQNETTIFPSDLRSSSGYAAYLSFLHTTDAFPVTVVGSGSVSCSGGVVWPAVSERSASLSGRKSANSPSRNDSALEGLKKYAAALGPSRSSLVISSQI